MSQLTLKLALPLLCVSVFAQAPFTAPPEIDYRKADMYSEGTRMSAELFSLKNLAGKKLPTILMAHGWGGVKASLRPDAVLFAKSGTWWSPSTIAAKSRAFLPPAALSGE